ncbi:MAG: putative metallopeptidase [Sporomusaceae bacterium]|nr:putative metallopeptidase [Sporomusaceae bacterium]
MSNLASEFYDASDDLIEMASELIQENHSHLVEAKIKYLFRDGTWEVKRRETWGQAKKVGKELNFLTGYDFIVTIHQDVWWQLGVEHRKALLDHELQHCSAGTDDHGNKTWYIQGHDFEDFQAIVRRHGLWSPALKKIETLLNQTELQFEDPKPPEEELPALAGRPDLKVISSQPVKQLEAPANDEDDESQGPKQLNPGETDDIIEAEIVEESETVSEGPIDVTDHEHLGTSPGTGTEG